MEKEGEEQEREVLNSSADALTAAGVTSIIRDVRSFANFESDFN